MVREKRNFSDNLLDMIPAKLVQSQENRQTSLVSLLKPKFKIAFVQKRLKNPYYKVNLDMLGSLVWKNIDGKRNVYAIAKSVQDQSDPPLEQLYDRIGVFIKSLHRNRLIRLNTPIQSDS